MEEHHGRRRRKQEKISVLYLSIRARNSFISELFKVIQDAIPLIFHFRMMCQYIYHIGCAISVHSITNSGLIAGGQNSSGERQTVFFTSVDLMNKEHRDPNNIDLEAPRLAWYKQKKWKRYQDTVYWVDIKTCST